MSSKPMRWWMLTIPQHLFMPYLPPGVCYLAGQLEVGSSGTQYLHWQLVGNFKSGVRMSFVKKLFGKETHAEPTRSEAAREYVAKQETSVPGTYFELGVAPTRRNNAADWAVIANLAREGNLQDPGIPPDVFVRNYHSLRAIQKDYCRPLPRGPQKVVLFWGKSGTGKTRRVFDEIGDSAFYLKAPTTKWWDGYRGESIVVIDEFRGVVDISHLLKWLDRYPCAVEIKGGQVALKTTTFYITSNLSMLDWYPMVDTETILALTRRISDIIEFN